MYAEEPELPYLATFTAAAERSSFTAAAQALRLTQAAVSQRVRALEQTVGQALFRRQGGRVLLTPAGQRLYEYAQRILQLHQEARQEITGRRVPVSGELTLAASSVPGEHLLPAILGVFRRRYPHIQVRVTVSDSLAVIRQVEQGQAQLGLVGRKDNNPNLEYRSFACDELVLVVPAAHAWAGRKRVTLDRLARQPLLLREVGSGSRWCLEQALAQAGKSPRDLNVVLELGSNEGIKEAVLQGLGVAVLSRQAVRKELQSGRLRALHVANLDLHRNIFAVWDRRRVLPIPARIFLDFLEPCPQKRRRP